MTPPNRGPFEIVYDRGVVRQMRDGLERHEQATVEKSLDVYLLHEPTVETRNRKSRRQPCPFGATWALRLGNLRVYYDVIDEDNERVIIIVAIGKKVRERVRIGGTFYEASEFEESPPGEQANG